MSEGGSIKARLDKVEKELEKEQDLWREAKLPPCPAVFNLGEQQFEVHLHIIIFTELFKRLFEEDELNLLYKETALRELRKLRPVVQQQVKEMMRRSIMDGIVVKHPKPEI